MFGLPGEKINDFEQAAEFYSRLKYLNRIKCHTLTYFPNLPIVDIARKRGVLTEEDVDNIFSGQRRDNFFHPCPEKDSDKQKVMRNFQVFYKILPLLPKRWTDSIIQKRF